MTQHPGVVATHAGSRHPPGRPTSARRDGFYETVLAHARHRARRRTRPTSSSSGTTSASRPRPPRSRSRARLHLGFGAPRRATTSTRSGEAGARRGLHATTARPDLRPEYGAGLLRRLPARPRRQQRRGGPPRRRSARRGHDRPPVDPGRRRRGGEGASTTPSRPTPGCGAGRTSPSARTSRARAARSRSSRATPTEHLHLAFPAPDLTTVEAFHRAAIEAGYPDNGAPGERPQYHPGYHGALRARPPTATTSRSCSTAPALAARGAHRPGRPSRPTASASDSAALARRGAATCRDTRAPIPRATAALPRPTARPCRAAAAAARPAASTSRIACACSRRAGPAEHLGERGHERGVARDVADHRGVLAVVGVDLARAPCAAAHRGRRSPPTRPGRAAGGSATKCAEQAPSSAAVVGEVVVDRDAARPRAPRDLRDRRARRADLGVQRDRRLDDPLPRLLLAAGALLELVVAGHSDEHSVHRFDSTVGGRYGARIR